MNNKNNLTFASAKVWEIKEIKRSYRLFEPKELKPIASTYGHVNIHKTFGLYLLVRRTSEAITPLTPDNSPKN